MFLHDNLAESVKMELYLSWFVINALNEYKYWHFLIVTTIQCINVKKTTNLYAIMTPEKTVWQQQFAGFF